MIYRLLVFVSMLGVALGVKAQDYNGKITYNSYKGLIMAGYQGWFNAPDDGDNRGWHHYEGYDGFHPGSTNVDLWPDVTEYEKVYKTPFVFDDGSPAYLQSPSDMSTVDTHFRWMKEYGLDGVFMQRFLSEIRNESGRRHFDRVLTNAMTAANKYGRAICVMYDLSGMVPGEELLLLEDIKELTDTYHIREHSKNPSYLYHNGKPLVCVWGVGFNDHRRYGLKEANIIVDNLKKMGYSVMLGVPTNWRKLEIDTENDAGLHDVIRKCDIVMPWFVGRYNEDTFPKYKPQIKADLEWAAKNNVDYAPLCYPGFSWRNMHYPCETFFVPRNGGRFFSKQLDYAIEAGAQMIYVAMFDEIDEGTAIMKCAHKVPAPAPGSTFLPIEDGVDNDVYLKLAGQAGEKLKNK